MRARTVLPLSRSAQCDWVTFLRCSGVSVLMSTSVKTCCDFIGSLSFFIPSIVFCSSSPSVLLTIRSRKIRSVSSSMTSSRKYAIIRLPCCVSTETLVRSFVFGGSAIVSGLARPHGCSVVRCCFGKEPSATHLLLFVGLLVSAAVVLLWLSLEHLLSLRHASIACTPLVVV